MISQEIHPLAIAKRGRRLFGLLLLSGLLLTGCRSVAPARQGLTLETAYAEIRAQNPESSTQVIRAKATVHFFWKQFPFLVVGQIDHATRSLRLAGMATTGGAKLFQIAATPDEIQTAEISPLAPPMAKRAFKYIAIGLARAFLDNAPIPSRAEIQLRRNGIITFEINGLKYTYAGRPLTLRQKASRKPQWVWRQNSRRDGCWQYVDRKAHFSIDVTLL